MGDQNGDLPVYCKMFIGGIAYTTTDDMLKSAHLHFPTTIVLFVQKVYKAVVVGFYEQWGDVVDSIVMRDQTGRSRGFGFVTYKTQAQV